MGVIDWRTEGGYGLTWLKRGGSGFVISPDLGSSFFYGSLKFNPIFIQDRKRIKEVLLHVLLNVGCVCWNGIREC